MLALVSMETEIKTKSATIAVVNVQTHHTHLAKMSQLEKELHICIEKLAPQFKHLSVWNISNHWGLFKDCQNDILCVIKKAKTEEVSANYKKVQIILEKMDIDKNCWGAVDDFKKVLSMIPKPTKDAVAKSITSSIIKKKLGL